MRLTQKVKDGLFFTLIITISTLFALLILKIVVSIPGVTNSVDPLHKVVSQMRAATYHVVSYDESRFNDQGHKEFRNIISGTGFILDLTHGQVLITNAHICGSPDRKIDTLYSMKDDGTPIYRTFRVIAFNSNSDLCAAKVIDGYKFYGALKFSSVGPAPNGLYGSYGFGGGSGVASPKVGIYLEQTTGATILESILSILPPTVIDEFTDMCVNELEGYIDELIFNSMLLFNCLRDYSAYVYSFEVYGGDSGSAVIDLRTGHVVGVIFAYTGENHIALSATYSDLVTFLKQTQNQLMYNNYHGN